MRLFVLSLGLFAVAGCNYSSPDNPIAPGSEVGGTGNIRSSEETLSPGMFMLKVSVAPGLLESETSMGVRSKVMQSRCDFS